MKRRIANRFPSFQKDNLNREWRGKGDVMRIGIDITSALTQGGGIGRYTRELIHALVETDFHNRFDISFFSAKIDQAPPVPDAIPTHPQVAYRPAFISEKWLYRLWYRLRQPIPVQLFTGPLDLFHSPDFVLPPVWGNIPTLLTVHDLSFVHYPHVFTPTLVNYLNRVVPWSVYRATHILADSAATKRDLIDIWHVPQKRSPYFTAVFILALGRLRSPVDSKRFEPGTTWGMLRISLRSAPCSRAKIIKC